MVVYVSEHIRNYSYRQPLITPPVATYSISSASTANFPSAGVNCIMVSADAASLLNISATSTGVALTSTNAMRIPANAPPLLFAVSTSARLQAAST